MRHFAELVRTLDSTTKTTLKVNALSEYFKQNSRYLQFLVFEERDSNINENALGKLYEEDLLKILLGDSEKPYLSATNVLSRPFLLIGFALSRDFWVVAFETSIFFIILKSLKA